MTATQQSLVVAHLLNERRSTETHIENLASLLSSVTEATQNMQQYGYSSGVDEGKSAFLSLLQHGAALSAHKKAVQDMQLGYQPPSSNLDVTDFQAQLEAATERHTATSFDAEQQPQYTEFLEAVGLREGQAPDAADEDGDLLMEQGNDLAPNRTCPLSMVEVLDIEDPVEDSRGFVYQKQNILDYIRSKPGGITIAPIAGAIHEIRVAELRPAKKVIKAQRKARIQPTQTQRPLEDDVLDVI